MKAGQKYMFECSGWNYFVHYITVTRIIIVISYDFYCFACKAFVIASFSFWIRGSIQFLKREIYNTVSEISCSFTLFSNPVLLFIILKPACSEVYNLLYFNYIFLSNDFSFLFILLNILLWLWTLVIHYHHDLLRCISSVCFNANIKLKHVDQYLYFWQFL